MLLVYCACMSEQRGVSTAFVAMGASSALLPSTIPLRANEMGLLTNPLLLAIPFMFLGIFVGIIATPIISSYLKSTTHIRGALILQGIGVLGVGLQNSLTFYWTSAAILGFGFGQLEVLLTSTIRRSFTNVSRALTKFGAYLSLSAFLTPLLVIVSKYFQFLDLCFISIAIASIITSFSFTSVNAPENKLSIRNLKIGKKSAFYLSLASAFYVGAETILSGWSAVYFTQYFPTISESAPLGTSLFWLFLTLGRFAGIHIRFRADSSKQLLQIWSTLFAIFSIFLALIANDANGFVFLFLISAAIFCAGPCYGLIIGIAVSLYDKKYAITASSVYILIGATGGTLIPVIAQWLGSSDVLNSILVCAFAATFTALFATLSLSSKRATTPQS